MTVLAAAALTLATLATPAIPIENPHPTGDQPGTWDAVFTHDELETIRRAGGLTFDLIQLIEPRVNGSGPAGGISLSPSPVNPGRASHPTNVEQWRPLVQQFFPSSLWDWAMRVLGCESGGNPNAYNPSTASGLFQIKTFWLSEFPGDLFDPVHNVRTAAAIATKYGTHMWVCK